jgi:thioredoxin 1
MVGPILDKIAREQDAKLVIAKVNTDENPEWATQVWRSGHPHHAFRFRRKSDPQTSPGFA